MPIRMPIHISRHMSTRMSIPMSIHISVHMPAHIPARLHTCIHTCLHTCLTRAQTQVNEKIGHDSKKLVLANDMDLCAQRKLSAWLAKSTKGKIMTHWKARQSHAYTRATRMRRVAVG